MAIIIIMTVKEFRKIIIMIIITKIMRIRTILAINIFIIVDIIKAIAIRYSAKNYFPIWLNLNLTKHFLNFKNYVCHENNLTNY